MNLPEVSPLINHCPLDIGVICRPKPGQVFNGDTFSIDRNTNTTLISLIDGLGHGELACKAAMTAKDYIENHSEKSMLEIFRNVNQACINTNGVVMALANFDWLNGTLSFASVGNIEAKLLNVGEKSHLPITRGIVGRNSTVPKVSTFPIYQDLCLILHTDGVNSKWRWSDFDFLHNKPSQYIAEHIHRKHHLEHDDATLMIIKQNRNEQH